MVPEQPASDAQHHILEQVNNHDQQYEKHHQVKRTPRGKVLGFQQYQEEIYANGNRKKHIQRESREGGLVQLVFQLALTERRGKKGPEKIVKVFAEAQPGEREQKANAEQQVKKRGLITLPGQRGHPRLHQPHFGLLDAAEEPVVGQQIIHKILPVIEWL